MKLTKYNTVLLVLLLSSFSVTAMNFCNKNDSMSCSTMVTRHFGYVEPGVAWLSIDNLNDYLVMQGLSPFEDRSPSFTIGHRKEFKRLYFESGLTFRYFDDHTKSNLKTSLYNGTYLWNTGFNLLPQNLPMTIFPFAGIGVGGTYLHVRSDSRAFSDAIVSNGPDITMWQGAFLLNAGAGSDFILSKKDRGFVIGIRGGYIYDPFTSKREWRSNGTKITNLPNLDQSGPYIQLVIGGWGERKKK
ncbi:MAG: hypothetical protein ACM31E_07840 [Fibrobacterota bacterium]|nr:hypothetical protein [Chitinispirillaceae bacterium]